MKKLLLISGLLLLPVSAIAADGIREGLWKITTNMEMPGMPFAVPPMTIEHCYTKEDVKDQSRVINTDKNCKVTDMKIAGDKVTWKMKCTGKSAGTYSGETVMRKDSYDSVMKMKQDESPETMTVKVKGKRLGNCP